MRPVGSKRQTEKSWPSRACWECAVRWTVVPISTVIDWSAPQTTPSVIGSRVLMASRRRGRGRSRSWSGLQGQRAADPVESHPEVSEEIQPEQTIDLGVPGEQVVDRNVQALDGDRADRQRLQPGQRYVRNALATDRHHLHPESVGPDGDSQALERGWSENGLRGTGVHDEPGRLVPLEDGSYHERAPVGFQGDGRGLRRARGKHGAAGHLQPGLFPETGHERLVRPGLLGLKRDLAVGPQTQSLDLREPVLAFASGCQQELLTAVGSRTRGSRARLRGL